MVSWKDDYNATAGILPATEMIYYTYEGNFQLECMAKILSCRFVDDDVDEKSSGDGGRFDGKEGEPTSSSSSSLAMQKQGQERVVRVCLDRTVLHAQGGGQPTDTGRIEVFVMDDEDHHHDIHKKHDEMTTTNASTATIDVTNILLDRTTGVAVHTGKVTMSRSAADGTDDREEEEATAAWDTDGYNVATDDAIVAVANK